MIYYFLILFELITDFEWLQNILYNLFVRNIIPQLSKKNVGDKFNEDLIHKRLLDMKMFLDFILADPLLKSSQIIYDFFLLVKKKMKFNLILKKIVIKRPNNLLQIKTVNGIDSSNSEIEKTVSKIKNNSDFMINFFSVCDKLNTIYENCKSINVNMKGAWELFEKISMNEFVLNSNIYDDYKHLSAHMKIYNDLFKNEYE